MPRVGFLYTRIRAEEKYLLEKLEKQPDVEVVHLADGDHFFDIAQKPIDVDLVLARSVSYSRGLYITRIFEAHGIPVINPSLVAERCGDKYITSQILTNSGLPTPRVLMAFDSESALKATESLGYPCVLKPVVGSWGRLLAKADSRSAAESIIEHKSSLGVNHQVFYIQEYIEKPGRDIRAFVVGDECICAIYRTSASWITNTARGGIATNCPVTPAMLDLCRRATQAIIGSQSGGLLALDLFETDNGYTINEINHTMEFRNSIATTGVDIPGRMIDYVISQAR